MAPDPNTAPPFEGVLPTGEPAAPAGVARPSHLLRGAGLIAAAIALALIVGTLVAHYPFGFDRAIILALHGAGPAWVHAAMIDITALGGGTVLTIVTVLTAGLLLVRRLWLTALLTVAATLTGSWVVDGLKHLFGRARPDVVDHIVAASGYSFPSGHSANSAIVYITIAALVSQVVRGRATRRYLIAAAILLVGAIGTSRVYLGVHWPTDVLAGWSFGTLWALGWWFVGVKARTVLVGRPATPDGTAPAASSP